MSGISGSDDMFLTGEAGGGRADDFLIVGMGASAGGITAFKQFFERVPADSGMAYVVILHLSPEHDSKLAEVLQTSAAIPVAQVVESIKIEPNHVYVIPPNKSLSMDDGILALSEIKGYEERRAPVDIFFRTLASEHTMRAVSVILSGTGADGSMGVKRVKEMGGIILVQDPREAEHSDMPRNSIATGLVDYVLPVAEIPAKIIAYKENLKKVGIRVGESEQPETDEQGLRDIFTQLRLRTRHDFSNYKRATVLRRLERRINVHELASLPDYARFMREHKEEAQALLKDLLISVTNFFRDAEAFQSVEQKIIPQLFEGKGAEDYVRVWVAGCATGEEAYSLTMLMLDYAAKLPAAPSVQVFATDLDDQALSIARDGLYTNSDVADVPPERLRHYFMKETDGYRVRRELRETVLFASHNLIKDPPFSHLDLISCRNLLIYLNRTAQERVMQVMHFALNPGGFLFLGTSESVDGAGDLFVTVEKEAHVYQGRIVTPRVAFPLPDVSPRVVADPGSQTERTREPRVREDRVTYSDLHHRLIEQYGPPSVVVNEEYTIVHLSERAGRYLQFTGGEASLNLLKVVRPELRLELRTALYQAVQNRTNVEARGIAARLDDGAQTVNLMVRPVLRADDTARGFFLVLFEEEAADANAESHTAAAEAVRAVEPAMLQLEDELTRLKAQLRSNLQQYETQAEEMKASNEELQAMNEELRSSAEELETSKEELQSLNEELHTVNQELKIKIEELSHANNDFRNLMFSTDIGTIFLDRSLRIKLFTPRARDIFKLIPADVGRPLSDISSNLPHNGLLADVETVLDRLHTVEREVGTRDGRFYLIRLVPYRTAEDRIEGVVLNFVDITERRRAEEDKFFLASIVESSQDSVITINFDRKITSWNRAAEILYGYAAAEAVGKPLTMLTLPEDLREVLANIDKVKHSETVEIFDAVRMNRDGRQMNLEVLLSPVKNAAGKIIGVSTIARDVTERRRAEEALRESEARVAIELTDTQQLQSISNLLIEEENIDALYEQILESAVALMRSDMGSLQVLDPERNQLRLLAWKGFHPEAAAFWEKVNAHTGSTCGAALSGGERLIIPNVKTSEFVRGSESSKYYELSGITAVQSTPLISRDGHLVGMVSTHWRAQHTPGERELRMLDVLARQTADLIERKRAKEALRESEERLRLLVESVKDYAIFTLDAERHIRSWNPGAELIFGFTESDIIGQSGDCLFTPEDREMGIPEKEVATALATGRAGDERWHIRKDGTRFYASGVLVALGSDIQQGFAKIARDLTEQKRAEEDLQLAHDEMEGRVHERTAELLDLNETLLAEVKERTAAEARARQLMRQIVTAQEDERRSVARDLHDHLGQQLTGLRIKLENHKQSCGGDPSHRAEVEQIQAIAERLDTDVDFLSWELRPASLDELGLPAALSNFVREWSEHFDIPAEFHTTGLDRQRLPQEVEINLYRIAQEALNNISKHSGAGGVDVLLERRDHHVALIVEDNGKGFEADGAVKPDGKRIGLLNMRERAAFVGGMLEIESTPGEGTTVFARVPIRADDAPRESVDGDGGGGNA